MKSRKTQQAAFVPPPADAPCASWPDHPEELARYCTYVQIACSTSLCEYKDDGTYYYSVTLEADESPLVICALERYLTDLKSNDVGRRCDYVCVGWYNGECYLVFIELRKELDCERHWENKFEQLRQTLVLLCKSLDFGKQFHRTIPPVFNRACDSISVHKTLGLIIPVQHSRARAEQSGSVSIDGNGEVPIVAIPSRILKEQRISWTNLLNQAVPQMKPRR
jgi:hypothetical protein